MVHTIPKITQNTEHAETNENLFKRHITVQFGVARWVTVRQSCGRSGILAALSRRIQEAARTGRKRRDETTRRVSDDVERIKARRASMFDNRSRIVRFCCQYCGPEHSLLYMEGCIGGTTGSDLVCVLGGSINLCSECDNRSRKTVTTIIANVHHTVLLVGNLSSRKIVTKTFKMLQNTCRTRSNNTWRK